MSKFICTNIRCYDTDGFRLALIKFKITRTVFFDISKPNWQMFPGSYCLFFRHPTLLLDLT